ncbi:MULTISPECIES: alkaline shock response membrane anchor protein AmaP [Lactococcus]|uniref:alkaline shock response membrane anchor protein AmaP n=1 Tax=Lactococcus TaxID=1357 RepID=UPI00254E1E51|nr:MULTISPECIES: alkaline shock response membrane anchor protein AmaP [Lactococcus]
MSKTIKLLFFFAYLILLSVIIPTLWMNFNAQDFQWKVAEITQFPRLNQFTSEYMFWFSLFLGVLLTLTLIIILFLPKTYLNIILDSELGELTLKRSAIEGLVREKIEENQYIKNPKIKVLLFRRKIKVLVKGDILPRNKMLERTQYIGSDLQEYLETFFGLTHKLKLDIKIKGVDSKKSSSSLRVE